MRRQGLPPTLSGRRFARSMGAACFRPDRLQWKRKTKHPRNHKGFLNRRFKRVFAYFCRGAKVGAGSGGADCAMTPSRGHAQSNFARPLDVAVAKSIAPGPIQEECPARRPQGGEDRYSRLTTGMTMGLLLVCLKRYPLTADFTAPFSSAASRPPLPRADIAAEDATSVSSRIRSSDSFT